MNNLKITKLYKLKHQYLYEKQLMFHIIQISKTS